MKTDTHTSKKLIIYIIFGGILIWFITQILYPASTQLTHGFSTYYTATRLLTTNQITARIYNPPYFRSQVELDTYHQISDIYNANPPTTSFLFLPLNHLTIKQVRLAWTILNAIFLWSGVALLIWTFSDSSPPILYALLLSLAMLFQPVISNIQYGQAYLLIFWLLALASIAHHKKHPFIGGLSLALTLVLKTAGLALVPLLVWQRQGQYLGWTLGIGTGILLFTVPWLPLDMWFDYIDLLRQTNASALTCAPAYQTTRSLLCQLFILDATWSPNPIINMPLLARTLLIGLGLSTLIINFSLSKYQQRLAWLSMLIWGSLFAPVGEQYHHTILLIPIIWLLIQWQHHYLTNPLGKICLVISIIAYLIPFDIGHSNFQLGWWALLAYPRLYSAWLILLALYSLPLQHHHPRLLYRRFFKPLG